MQSKSIFKSSLPFSSPYSSTFEFKGFIDADLISSFANSHPKICIDVRTIFELTPAGDTSRVYKLVASAQFNTAITKAFFARPGLTPGPEVPELHTRGIFYQATRQICISFRDGEKGANLAFLHFNKRENKIDGSIYKGRSPSLEKIEALISGLRIDTPETRPMANPNPF